MTSRAAVLGSPISHSLSPAMHRAAYAALDLRWSYTAFDVAEGELAEFVSEHPWAGFSVTAPLKREAAAVATSVDNNTALLGVANTLVPTTGGWTAANTDVPGAANALREVGVTSLRTVRVLGAGATSASIALACRQLGATSVELRARDARRAEPTAAVIEALGLNVSVVPMHVDVVESVDLLVSTVPGDAIAGREHEFVGAASAVYDVVYDPWPTAIGRSAQRDGTTLVTGIDLLAHQAVLQVDLMTGRIIDPQVLREAALAALGNR